MPGRDFLGEGVMPEGYHPRDGNETTSHTMTQEVPQTAASLREYREGRW